MDDPIAVQTESLSHSFGDRLALQQVSFTVMPGETFALLGPNGGGKTTLFRILTTLLLPSQGSARILGFDVTTNASAVRQRLGVVFQSPSLDKKLTVRENLLHQGHLYGLIGQPLSGQIEELLREFGLADRAGDLVEKLSGGLQRRVELAKGLLHKPQLLIMDEPTTGLDPAARLDFWNYLGRIKSLQKLTILFTTHFMEEADRSDRLGILDGGKLVALGAPVALKEQVGGDVILIGAKEPENLREQIRQRFGVEGALMDKVIRIERPRGHEFIPSLIEAFPGQIYTVSFGKPTLEDVFIRLTGRRLLTAEASPPPYPIRSGTRERSV